MDLFIVLTEMIDLRSFSNLWYWIALAVLWSTASHWVLGIPFDMVGRASRNGGQAEQDLHDLVRIQVNRAMYIHETSGVFLVSGACFMLTGLVLLGFVYNVEFAQAVFLMMFPMSFVSLLNVAAARKIHATQPDTASLCARLSQTRICIQLIGIVSIFVTGLWGMYQNLVIGAFG